MLKRNPTFGALFHNELEKLWAHRARALIIAFLVIVLGGSLLTYRSYVSSQHQVQLSIQQLKGQLAQMRHQETRATGKQKLVIQQNLAQDEQILHQLKSQGPVIVNLRPQLRGLESSLKHEPTSVQRGPTLEQIALDKAALAHGIKFENPAATNGFKLAGDLFGGATMLIFGLIAAGLTSDRVSSELEGGTWGVLLLHAPRRIQVYWAKLASAIAVTWGFMAATAIGMGILAGILMGFGPADFPEIVGLHLKSGAQPNAPLIIPIQSFHVLSQWSYDIFSLVLAMLAIGVLAAIFLALSLLTRSTVFSLIVAAVLVISGVLAQVVAHAAGWLAIIDPAVHMPLVGDWTGSLATQYNLAALTLKNGILVLAVWAIAAILVGIWAARRLDL